MSFTEATVLVVVLHLLVERARNKGYNRMLTGPGLVLGLFAVMQGQGLEVLLALWAVSWWIYGVYGFLRTQVGEAFTQWLPIRVLQEGMVPRQAICAVCSEGADGPSYAIVEEVEEGQEIFCRARRPLTANKVRQLRRMAQEGMFRGFGEHLEVELSLPFAPALLVGVVLTAVLGGSLVKLPALVEFYLKAG